MLNCLRWCCRHLAVNFDQGGMPWTCLPGEPSNVNWCNSAQGEGLYKNPPQAWLGANDHGESKASPSISALLSVLPRMLLYCCCTHQMMTEVPWLRALVAQVVLYFCNVRAGKGY